MKTSGLIASFLLSALLAAPALAQTPRMAALSDLQALDADLPCPRPEQLGTSFSALIDPGRDLRAQGGIDALRQNLAGPAAEAIAGIEEQLRALPANDPLRPQLEAALRQLRAEQGAPPPPARAAAPTPAAALATLRRAVGAVAAPGSARLLETSAESRDAGSASRGAALAAVTGKPQLALGLMLRAAALEPRNPAHLVNLAGLANYYGLFAEALALVTAAEQLQPPASLRPLRLSNKGHALLRLRRLPEAETALRAAAQADPNLQEARVNLAYALGAQNRCAEAQAWARRAWWRHDLGALDPAKSRARPLTEAFAAAAPAPPLPRLTFILPGQAAGGQEALDALRREIAAQAPRLEEFQAARGAQARRSVALRAEPRVGPVQARWADFLAGAQDAAVRLGALNDFAPGQGRELEAAEAARNRLASDLSPRFGASPGCANAAAWRAAALPTFQAADTALRAAYAEAWRAAAALTARFSEPTSRSVAALNLRNLYVQAARKAAENAQQYLNGLTSAQGNEACGGAAAPLVGALATPEVPAACAPVAAPPVPARGWRVALSCERAAFGLATPPWMDRYQIQRGGLSPLVFSQLDFRLAIFVPGGFVRLTAEGAVMDAGATLPSARPSWSFVWAATGGGVGFASSERQFGVQ